MHFYAPKSAAAEPTVVVALHGCTQSAQAYAAAGWNELADERGFFVVYPEQVTTNNFNRCFRWFEPAHIARGGGEAASIAAMAEYAKRATGAKRAFVTGLSAGGAMTAVMLATYPDVFEAGAVMAGLPYRCANGMVDAYSCMSPGRAKTGDAWGDLVRAASSVSAKARLQVWHGASDATVKPMNAGELAKQWANVTGVSETPSKTDKVGTATHKTFVDGAGVVRVETYEVPGMSHGVAVDPKSGCGKAGAFVLDTGLCSSKLAADFFGI
jgi:poly(hydroxyalkanoate) depolymerase family esterase